MAYGIRIKSGISAGDFEGMFMTEAKQVGGIDYPSIKTWKTKKEASEFLKNLYKGENWEIVKLS